MKKFFCLALLLCQVGAGQDYDPKDFNLAPGEILVSVNGVPVNQNVTATRSAQPIRNAIRGVAGLVVNRDANAYAHALREAQILASRGEGYYRFRDGGHPLGVAPGCSRAGTGYSRDPNRPNHCWLGELPDSRLVARAMVPGPNGTYFWSAHYR